MCLEYYIESFEGLSIADCTQYMMSLGLGFFFPEKQEDHESRFFFESCDVLELGPCEVGDFGI